MNYRFYKRVLKDCDKAVELLSESEPGGIQKLWARGLVSDFEMFLERDEHTERGAIGQLLNMTKSFDCSAGWFEGFKAKFISTIQVKIRMDCILARAVNAANQVFLARAMQGYQQFDIRFVAVDFYTYVYGDFLKSNYNSIVSYLTQENLEFYSYNEYDFYSELPDFLYYAITGTERFIPQHLSCNNVHNISRCVYTDHAYDLRDLRPVPSSVINYSWLNCKTAQVVLDSYNPKLGNEFLSGNIMSDRSFAIKELKKQSSPGKDYITIFWDYACVYFPLDIQSRSKAAEVLSDYIIEQLENIKKVLKKYENIRVWLRPHPLVWASISDTDAGNATIQEAKGNSRLHLDLDADITPALIAADIMVSQPSSINMQYAVFCQPMFLLFSDDISFSSDAERVFYEGIKHTYDVEDILPFIDRCMEDYQSQCRQITDADEYYMGYTDGRVCRRIYKAILDKFIHEEKKFIDIIPFEIKGGVTPIG